MPKASTVAPHVIAATLSLVLAVFLGLLFDRRTVIELDASQSFIQPNPASPGERIAITWAATAHRNCAGKVIPRLFDSTGRVYEYARIPTVYQDLLAPAKRTFTKEIVLPTVMAYGPAHYEAVVRRWCNPVQQYLWPMTDRPFPIPFVVE